ncbi:bifunctional acetate--CoA ligase family protein/GNAT family N-acetyltransferase [Candidatus Manganitrophus noduliformans]|uniref:Bifunctional acetate--CoA ligase family protein/GNAT family N-acetyltransferase n=1 Tax=Candidatus Manganitrophus noduliformans TaxID=2606439 RepID=A0A7X6DN68_9BACT|nr:bifunctional acetate--CoA ligase family protein/GNAT family N-acetyltransferase [Candidatus Manganitrophus noduliformans]NKE70008.1 bifunctional acetate--CoA ligase family protein/GNAT family N-acetyltransferase [Candidatus Manganitrophus noduliformans]
MSKIKPIPEREPAHDIFRRRHHPLDVFFSPRTVALIGATESEGSVGRTILRNLIGNPFGGVVFPINPKRSSVLGIKAYPSIAQVPERIDLAVIATPAQTVPGIIRECVQAGARGAIIISAGFKEAGAAGVELERQILAEARRGKMRIIGPNCLGVMSPLTGLNATFAGTMARPGNVGFISQSGALCTAILDWSLQEMVGFSAFVSIGSMLDVNWGDLIGYLGEDPRTQSIVLYMESIGDARSFISAAREVALTKPIIVIKAGRTKAAAKAAASHTGALTGSDEVLHAAFRRSGVLRVNSIADLFYMAEVLAKQPRPKGPRLTIVTNAGGPAVLATDALILTGGALAELAPETIQALNQILPPHWSHGNPIDILGDASAERYAQAVEIAAKDPNSDGLLAVLAPQAMTDPTQTAERLKGLARLDGKPLLASWMGGADVAAGVTILNRAGVPTFSYPDTAVRAFNYMWRYSYNLRSLYETPVLAAEEGIDRAAAERLIQKARKSGRTLLTEVESKQLLAAYALPTVETRIAKNEAEAVEIAAEIGYPAVLKLHSETITHKSDVGGVQLNLANAAAVRRAYRAIEKKVKGGDFLGVTVQPMIARDGYELILGSSPDPEFGPVLLFGTGGTLVEVFQDRALGLPPLTTTLARRMMEQTKIFTALKGVRGKGPIDLAALEQLLVRFSRLVVEQRWIKEIDINPLLVSEDRQIALDARVVVHGKEVREEDLPKLAIRPYPAQYVSRSALKDGTPVTIRPIRPEDEPLMVRFHQALSDQSVYLRFFQPLKLSQRVAHERLTRICFIDYDREMALVVERKDPDTETRDLLGAARLTKIEGTEEAEFSILIADPYQRQGLGTELLRRLIRIGRDEHLKKIRADILPDNTAMQRVCKKLGFKIRREVGDPLVSAELEI